ncbi:MAG: serine/threonine protein kinase [Myxococcaceae bacterium]|nr:serine/threonine protein kinase [Myxococcaceae bacterium]
MDVIGRYQVVRKLGQGGMAEAFLATAAGVGGFQKSVVVKVILPAFAHDPRLVDLFFREARIAAGLNHPNVVQVFDFGVDRERPFLAMEFVDGLTLRQLLQREWGEGRPVPVPYALRIATQVCAGLGHAHTLVDRDTQAPRGVVHRDVSPDNVLLAHSGVVKVSDFGLARAIDATHSTALRGKCGYLAPEQMREQGRFDHRADLFALGVVLFETLTGRRPFVGPTDLMVMQAVLHEPTPRLTERRPGAPKSLEALVDRLLEKDPGDRPASAAEVLAELERIAAEVPPVRTADFSAYLDSRAAEEITATEPPTRPLPAEPAPRPGNRWRWLVLLGAAALAASLAWLRGGGPGR